MFVLYAFVIAPFFSSSIFAFPVFAAIFFFVALPIKTARGIRTTDSSVLAKNYFITEAASRFVKNIGLSNFYMLYYDSWSRSGGCCRAQYSAQLSWDTSSTHQNFDHYLHQLMS